MTEVVIVKVPTVKLLFFLLPFHIVFFGRKSHSAQLKSGSCAPPPSGHSSYTHDLEFFCLGDFFLLYTWGCNTIPLYFVIQIIPVWPLGANSQLITVSLWHILTILFLLLFFFFEKSLITFWHYKCSRLILQTPCPSPKIYHFSEEPWFFPPGNGIRNQDSGE